MKQSRSKPGIIWAIDPFEKVGSAQRLTADTIGLLARRMKVSVIPVYVLKAHADLPAPIVSHWEDQFCEYASELIKKRVAELGIQRYVLDPVVRFQKSLSLQEAVASLSGIATRFKARLIVASAKVKEGLGELFFEDSFSETLLYESRIPVLLLGGRVKSGIVRPYRILFPVDVTAISRGSLADAIKMASLLKARIHFLHVIQPPFDFRALPMVSAGPIGQGSVAEHKRDERSKAQSVFKRWIKRARDSGVRAEFTILETSKADPWKEIVRFNRKNRYSLIMMEDKSSPMSASILGSNTRQVVRHAECPVWVLKKRRKAGAKAKSSADELRKAA